MIEITVHDASGNPTGKVEVDEQLLGGEVRHDLLKQAYVRQHANRRLGTSKTKTRSETSYSTKKLYRQKGTGNARRGDRGANILRGGGRALAKRPRSFRQDMPRQMRRLANRNALLAKAVDNEIKLFEGVAFDAPSTKQFKTLAAGLGIDRTCLFAVADTRTPAVASARNLPDIDVTQIDRLNAFDVLNHRYLIADKAEFQAYLERLAERANAKTGDEVSAAQIEKAAAAADKEGA
ncbi:MAG: 50S ribosomal protein L4 [Planctomycetota bacterium]